MRATLKRHLVLLFLLILMNPVPARATPAPRPEALGPWTVQLLEEGLVHLELGPEPGAPIPISPYVDGCDYPGRYPGASARRGDDALTTARMTLRPRGRSLEVLNAGRLVLTLQATENGYRLEAPETRNLLGLGEQFPPEREEVEGTNLTRVGGSDWMGRERLFWKRHSKPHPFGNTLSRFLGGNVGNASFPVLYGTGTPCWMLFLDDPARQRWDFRPGAGGTWTVETDSPHRRLFLALGPDLQSLRRTYMGLVGRPPVPPRATFGLWVSEYGFEDWAEVEDRLAGLRRHHFPVDGFVLDLQWFGGVEEDSPHSRMGSLRWDETRFPDPARRLDRFRKEDGVGLILIEEPYISRGLPEHSELSRRGYLARQAPDSGTPFAVTDSNWWGQGGILDPTNPEGRRFWHAWRRQPLVDAGVLGHWIDLGEPECHGSPLPDGQVATPFYQQGPHPNVHNLYAHQWARGIWEGYARHAVDRRVFLLSRSGGPGIQRFGAAMWSGDIPATEESLAEHFNAQTNLALSGIDYFGSDVGGFFREVFPGTPEELEALYTRWFAAACAIDVPIRPHAFNLENRHATSPDRIGHVDSNRENLRWRYRLLPYYYSLAHEAARSGQPLVAPAACWFPGWESPAALAGHVKMIGPELLVALSADLRAERMDLELPPGDWMDLRTGARLQGRTDWSLKRDGRFELPLLARAGSILPMMVVDQDTMNAQGRRLHGPPVADLLLRVHSAPRAGRFLLTEDDGETRGWRRGELVTTELTRELRQDEEVVRIAPRQGTWSGAPSRRAVKVELVPPPGMAVRRATLNGTSLKLQRQGHLVVVHTDPLDPGRPAEFRFRLASSR